MKTADHFIPKTDSRDSDLYVSVNGRRFIIKRGIKVTLPLEVKEVLEASLRSEEEACRFINSSASL